MTCLHVAVVLSLRWTDMTPPYPVLLVIWLRKCSPCCRTKAVICQCFRSDLLCGQPGTLAHRSGWSYNERRASLPAGNPCKFILHLTYLADGFNWNRYPFTFDKAGSTNPRSSWGLKALLKVFETATFWSCTQHHNPVGHAPHFVITCNPTWLDLRLEAAETCLHLDCNCYLSSFLPY